MRKQTDDRKVQVASKLGNLLNSGQPVVVSFVNHDKSRVNRELHTEFTHKLNGRPRSVKDIMVDLNAIRHDMNAKYFSI